MPLSPASHASSVMQAKRQDAPKCKMVGEVKRDIPTTGPQRAVSALQTCNSPEACKFTVSNSLGLETSISFGKSETFTLTNGVEVSVTAGVNFFGKAEVSTTLQTSISNAWEKNESKTTTNQTLKGFSQEVSQQTGTTAILTYIPQYVCDQGTAECGKDKKGNMIRIENFKVCKAIDDVNAGRYQVVYTSD